MADNPKLVRLQNSKTGVVVETTADVATRLSGFEPVKKAAAKKTSESTEASE